MRWKEFWEMAAMLCLISFGVAVAIAVGVLSVLGLIALFIG
jgi:uncharacterized membrane protein